MPENVVISFVADTDQLQPAVSALESVIAADAQLGAEVKKTTATFADRQKALDQQNKSSTAAKLTLDQLSASVKELNKNVIGNASTKQVEQFATQMGQATGKATTLTTQLRALREQLSAMETAGKAGTKSFTDLAVKAAKLQDQIGDTAQRIRILASDTKNLDAALSVATGLAGSFAVVQGASALFGKENEDLQKALLKVQAALAILNGLQAVSATLNKDSAASVVLVSTAQKAWATITGVLTGQITLATVATQIWNAVLALNPFIAIAAAIGLVVAAIYQFVTATDASTIATQKDTEALQKKGDVLEENFTKQITLAKEAGKETLSIEQNRVTALLDILREEGAKRRAIHEQLTGDEKTANKERVDEIVKQEKELLFQEQLIEQQRYQNRLNTIVKLSALEIDAKKEGLGKELAQLTKAFNDKAEATRIELDKQGATQSQKNEAFLLIQTDFENKKSAIIQRFADEQKIKTDKSEQEKYLIFKKWFDFSTILFQVSQATLDQRLLDAQVKHVADLDELYKQDADNFGDAIQKKQNEATKNIKTGIEDDKKAYSEKLQALNEYVNAAGNISNALFQFAIQLNRNEIDALQEKHRRGLISEKAYRRQMAEFQRKAAIAEKEKAMFNIVIATATAVISALASIPPNIPLSIGAGVTGAIELAAVASRRIPEVPQFAKGTESVKGGVRGKDSVPAILMPGERIVPADINAMLGDIPNADLPKLLGVYPDLPYISNASMDAMEKYRSNGTGINYDLLADKLSERIAKHPRLSVNINEKGFEKRIIEGANNRKSLDDYYKWTG